MLAGTGNCQNHYNPLLFSLLSSIFPREIPPNTSILLDVVDVVFLIRILPSSNPLIGLIYPPSSAQSRQYNLSQSLQDTWSVHGTLPHSSHKNYHFSFCSCYYKPGILCACRPGLTGWPRPINIPGYLSHIPPRLATKQRRLIPAPHPVNHRMHHITVPLGAHSKHNWGEWWVGEPGGSWPTSRHQHLTI